jgi:DNA (cytosine-5)-methyltransferase 1
VNTTNKLKVAGFFSGVGGIETGFEQAGFEVSFANEIDKYAGVTYQSNHKHNLLVDDISNVDPQVVPKNLDLIVGGFPCQAFSVAGYRKGFEDPRGNIYWQLHRQISDKLPPALMLENVKNLASHDGGNTFRVIRESLEDLGYKLHSKVMNARDYGNIPQNRERVYIVGFQDEEAWSKFTWPNELGLSKRIDQLVDFEAKVEERYYYREDRPMYEVLKASILETGTVYQWRRHYVRQNKTGVCPTLTANMGTGGHNVPLIHTKHGIRKLTPKECFNLMGFPRSFKMPVVLADSHLYKQAGNAVVVPVVKRIAKQIKNALE